MCLDVNVLELLTASSSQLPLLSKSKVYAPHCCGNDDIDAHRSLWTYLYCIPYSSSLKGVTRFKRIDLPVCGSLCYADSKK